MSNDKHSRFDESHYRNCPPCRDDNIDFMYEQDIEAQMDAAEYQSEIEY